MLAACDYLASIKAESPGGVPEQVGRTVSKNGRTLKFTLQGFEEE